ncbi:hypothetical protein [Leekyejoonella antrihumi]|uniref:Right-handed parallel beta-helix repeat-containing protein n=1 Tax=Leekyejoonella antrihumi TaxID=1660198 RepID=A0A563E8K1_9MICO|nr:hypothetical protein [Leekyejoonella antrihumi]TWP38573.1 hypothetical protein FGL98_01930 [Leekyejoonella antrihumi]
MQGNVVVIPRAVLNAITTATVHIQGSGYAERGSILALGCTPEFGCTHAADQQVAGSVIGNKPLAVYLNGATVRRNVLVFGGGPAVGCVDTGFPPLGHDLPMKDNTIGGNVVIDGWAGCWAGLLRNTIGGSVSYSRVKANTSSGSNGQPLDPQGPDSNEIVANTIRGALVCWGNTPAPQFGDAGDPPCATNHAGCGKWGQCANL